MNMNIMQPDDMPLTLSGAIVHAAQNVASVEAIVEGNDRLTYAALYEKSNQVASSLNCGRYR